MKIRILSLGILLFWVVLSVFRSVSPASAQDWQELSSDIDGDGLTNEQEASGWYNKAGGPFITDPLDADSDDDGLTDGEEHLFDAIPVNGPGNQVGSRSPGIYVKYQDHYQTKEYFRVNNSAYLPMKEAGNRNLMTQAMVARRGQTLHIGGPVDGSLTVAGNGLASLNVQRDLYGGGWTVTLPSTAGGQVGEYVATISQGSWQKTMPIYVIFEIPSPQTSSQYIYNLPADKIEATLYNDNPADIRDETGVIFRTRIGTYTIDYNNDGVEELHRLPKGFAQSFWTDHYKKYVFIDQVMPRIHGLTSQRSATDALSRGADDEVRVNWSADRYIPTDMNTTLRKECVDLQTGLQEDCGTSCPAGETCTQGGSPCHAQAGVFTGFLRAAGIPAHPFITDHQWTQYDTSVMVWMNFNGVNQWVGARSYARSEATDTYKYYPFTGGITSARLLKDWVYGESGENVLVAVNDDWNFEQWRPKIPGETCPLGQSGDGANCFLGGTVGAIFPPDVYMNFWTWEYLWDSLRPLAYTEKNPHLDSLTTVIWQGRPWVPTNPPWGTTFYDLRDHPNYPAGPFSENWPIEPVPLNCPWGWVGECPYGVRSTDLEMLTLREDSNQPASELIPEIQTDVVDLGAVIDDYGLDPDGNGRFDSLAIELEVTAFQPGRYAIGGVLALPGDPTPYGGIYSNNRSFDLVAGTQTIQLDFEGLAISHYKVDGPYQVTGLWVTAVEDFDPMMSSWDEVLASKQAGYATKPYSVDQFETLGATLANRYSHRGLDSNSDGAFESVAVDVSLDIALPGTYQLEGDLYDTQSNYVGYATWSGSGSVATLEFDLEQTHPPYNLENLRLFDSNQTLLDSRTKYVYTITDLGGPVDQGGITMDTYASSGGIGALAVTPTLNFADRGVDLDEDGLYDQLVIDVQVNVTAPDGNAEYRVEGWLVDGAGNLLVYGLSEPTSIGTGLQTLSLPFDGRALNGQGVDGPYSVMALRILAGATYNVLDEIKVTGWELNYDASDFDLATEVASIFSDDLESGAGQWISQSPWNYIQKIWPASSFVWETISGAPSNLRLVSALDLSGYVQPMLTFQNSYQLNSSDDAGYVQISTNGVDWTTVATYTNSTDRWETALLDLSQFEKTANVQLRFRADFDDTAWNIDDITVSGWPGITDVSFEHSQPVIVGTTTTFTGSYSSIDMSLPVTYTWDFGDSTPPVTGQHVGHTFNSADDYVVQLTVENPYDNATYSQVVGSGNPITGATFTYEPLDPDTTTVISFTATYLPLDATNTVTHPIVHAWDFGDGTTPVTTTNPTITHTYNAGGSYPVKLTTTNDYGTAEDNQIILIKEGVSAVSFSTSGTMIEDDPVTFQPHALPDTATQPVTYTWSFGDGSPPIITTIDTIQHIFDAPATYTVWITADNGYSSAAVYSDTVEITGRPVTTASFTFGQTAASAEREATFYAAYGPANATQPITYAWNFGDGTIVSTANPTITHEFPALPQVATYTVILSASNVYGPPAAASQPVSLPFDDDGDGLNNVREGQEGTDPHDPDTDNDGRTDDEEVTGYTYTGYGDPVAITTDPLDPDSDGDGLSDGYEFEKNTNPQNPDTDGDGLTDGEEPGLYGTLDPLNPDTDSDGLWDGDEVHNHGTNPLDWDTDDDNLSDYDEVNLHLTDPLDPDSDDDTLTDGQEVNITTNPNSPDSDNDGIRDNSEVGGNPTTPRNTDGDSLIDALDPDSDNDGIPDATEWDIDQDTSTDDDLCANPNLDTDGDGIPNCQDNDADGDGAPNYRDFDADGDGLLDADEGLADDDNDDIPNYLDSDPEPNRRMLYLPLIVK